jgi:phosphoglucosamine mutase
MGQGSINHFFIAGSFDRWGECFLRLPAPGPLGKGERISLLPPNNFFMLFGSSGIRRPYGRELLDLAFSLGGALDGPGAGILIGRDTRATGPALEALMTAGLLGKGINVSLAGIAPTPAIGYGSRLFDAGVMITASHNPENYNGFKLFRPDGSSYTGPEQQRIMEGLRKPVIHRWDRQGSVSIADVISPYISAVTAARKTVGRLKIVLDCGNGAGSTTTPHILDQLDACLTCVNTNPMSRFARPSEPLEEHLSYLPALIRATGSAGAIAHDGDADRMMAFDGFGRFISGDQLMILFTLYLGAKKVVTTNDSSMAIEEVADVRRTPVGDTFVSEELAGWGDFGGEPSGAWIFPGHSLCPDGPYAAALFCEIAAEWDIAGVIDTLPAYPVIRKSYPCENAGEILSALGAVSPTEGIRVSEDDGWFLVRASGTEPKIRVTAEGRDREKAKKIFEKGLKIIKEWKTA